MKLVYIGNMSRSYDLATVIAAVKSAPGVELDLAGTGPDEPKLRALAGDGPAVRFHGYVAAADLAPLLAAADAAVVPMFPDSMVAVPGKFCEYARAGKPIVNSLRGETAALLAEYRCGVPYDAGDVGSFRRALAALAAADPQTLADGARRMYEDVFSASKVYPELVRFCYNILHHERTCIAT